MPRPQSGATKDRLVRVQARSVTGPRHRPPRAGAGWPCSPSPDRQGRDRPEVAPRPRQIDPSEQMLRLASAPRIRPPRAGSRTILAPMARTTPAVRAEITRSTEPTGVLAQRYGVSTETIRKWRKRGAADCQDHSSRPHKLPWKATEEERAIVCALRRATGFPLDDLTFVVTHFLPHLNRDAVYRILKAEAWAVCRPQAEQHLERLRSWLRPCGRRALRPGPG